MSTRRRGMMSWFFVLVTGMIVAFYAGVAVGAAPRTTTVDVPASSGSGSQGGTPLPYSGSAPATPSAPSQSWVGSDGKWYAAAETRKVPGGTWVLTWTALYALVWVTVKKKQTVMVPVYATRWVPVMGWIRQTYQRLVGYRWVTKLVPDGFKIVYKWAQTGVRRWTERILTGYRYWTERVLTGYRRWTEWVQQGWKTVIEKVYVGMKRIVDRVFAGYRWVSRMVFNGYKTVWKWVQTGWRWATRTVVAGYRAVTRWVVTGYRAVTRWVQTGWNWVRNWWNGLWSREAQYSAQTSYEPEYGSRTEYEPQYRTESVQEPEYGWRAEQVADYREERAQEAVYEDRVSYVPEYRDVSRTVANMVPVERTEPIYNEITHKDPIYKDVAHEDPVYGWVREEVPQFRPVQEQQPIYEDAVRYVQGHTGTYKAELVQVGVKQETREVETQEQQQQFQGWQGSWSYQADPAPPTQPTPPPAQKTPAQLNEELFQAQQRWWDAKIDENQTAMDAAAAEGKRLRDLGADVPLSRTQEMSKQKLHDALVAQKHAWWAGQLKGGTDGEKMKADAITKANYLRSLGAYVSPEETEAINRQYQSGTTPTPGTGTGTTPTNPGTGTNPTNPGTGTNPTNPGTGTNPTNPGTGTTPTTPGTGTDKAAKLAELAEVERLIDQALSAADWDEAETLTERRNSLRSNEIHTTVDGRPPTQNEVRWIQLVNGISETGYGSKTKAAVKRLQEANRIDPDDYVWVGDKTTEALKKATLKLVHDKWAIRFGGYSDYSIESKLTNAMNDSIVPSDLRQQLKAYDEAYAAVEPRYKAILNVDPDKLSGYNARIAAVKEYGGLSKETTANIDRKYHDQIEEAYRSAVVTLGSTKSDHLRQVMEDRIKWWKSQVPEWTQEWDKKYGNVAGGLNGWLLRLPMENAKLNTPYGVTDKDHKSNPHGGVDLVSYSGSTDIKAAASGKVVYAADTGDVYGKMVVVDHQNGWFTMYAHMEKIDAKVDAAVYAGTSLGVMGNTGTSTGPHLHFELREGLWDSKLKEPWTGLKKENPWLFLESEGWGINFRRLMSDEDFIDTSVTLEQVRKVLRTSATFKAYADNANFPVWKSESEDTGRKIDIAKLIWDSARAEKINPLLLLARLHTENSLLNADTTYAPNSSAIFWALGNGANDSGNWNANDAGIERQIKGAARTLANHFYNAPSFDKGPVKIPYLHPTSGISRTISANVVQNERNTIVSEDIGVENRATYALYQYTPHMIDLNHLANPKNKNRIKRIERAETFPDTYIDPQPDLIGGGNKLFVESWNLVKGRL